MIKSGVNTFQELGILEKSAELKIPQEQKRPANHVSSIYEDQNEISLYGKQAGNREKNSFYPKPRENIFASFPSDDNQLKEKNRAQYVAHRLFKSLGKCS